MNVALWIPLLVHVGCSDSFTYVVSLLPQVGHFHCWFIRYLLSAVTSLDITVGVVFRARVVALHFVGPPRYLWVALFIERQAYARVIQAVVTLVAVERTHLCLLECPK